MREGGAYWAPPVRDRGGVSVVRGKGGGRGEGERGEHTGRRL